MIPRREFLSRFSSLLVTPAFFRWTEAGQEKPQQERPPLEKILTPEELTLIQRSRLARDLENYFGLGYSCAEAMLMVSLRHLGLPENLVWAAGGFGGGLGQKDLCGFLTGGTMAIGLAAGQLKQERKEAKKRCSEAVSAYWEWWRTSTPLRCAEIRPPGSSSDVCRRLGVLAAAKLDTLLDKLAAGNPADQRSTGARL